MTAEAVNEPPPASGRGAPAEERESCCDAERGHHHAQKDDECERQTFDRQIIENRGRHQPELEWLPDDQEDAQTSSHPPTPSGPLTSFIYRD